MESKEVSGVYGKPKAPQRWPKGSGRGLDDDLLIQVFSCRVCLFSVLLGRLQVVPGGVELRPGRSQEVRKSPELQNGGLRALDVFPAILGCRVSRLLDQPSGQFLCDQRWCYVHRFVLRLFVFAFWSISSSGGSRRCQAASKEVSGGQGKPRAPER